jgi:hypothetical protein
MGKFHRFFHRVHDEFGFFDRWKLAAQAFLCEIKEMQGR